MKIVNLMILVASVGLSACASLPQGMPTQKKWVGVMAVKESPAVDQILREDNNNFTKAYPKLRKLLDEGKVAPAPGRYCLVPYSGGQPSDQPECFDNPTGVYTMWAPSSMVRPGVAMCAKVPDTWPAIAGQVRYPRRGGYRVNCYDFGQAAADPSFAASRYTAAMVVLVEPAN